MTVRRSCSRRSRGLSSLNAEPGQALGSGPDRLRALDFGRVMPSHVTCVSGLKPAARSLEPNAVSVSTLTRLVASNTPREVCEYIRDNTIHAGRADAARTGAWERGDRFATGCPALTSSRSAWLSVSSRLTFQYGQIQTSSVR